MNEGPRDASLFIGLHKLAAQNGDGLVPELYALLTARGETDMTNVVAFPSEPKSQLCEVPADETGRVLAFRR